MEEKKHIVISLGGSLIVPDEVDSQFLKEFTDMIKDYAKDGFKFVIITGGGKIARKYQNVAKEISNASNNDLDWLGIRALCLNAELLRVVFGDTAYGFVVLDTSGKINFDKSVVIGAAHKPGSSTDLSAIMAAKNIGAEKVINLSNIDYAYDKDPNKFPDAKKLESVSWSEYRSLIPAEWNPGLSTPFDPIASKMAEEAGLEVAILNGKNIDNLKNYLDGKEFVGTVIK